MQDIWIVVPVGNRHKYLSYLLDTLIEYKNKIVFINNKSPYPIFKGVYHIEDFEEINISRWWNAGIEFAKKHGADYVVVMNDDIEFNPSVIKKMVNEMIKGEYEVSSASGNIGAFWIIDTTSEIRADENLRWWCGDGDIFRQADLNKKFLNYRQNEVKHLEHNLQTMKNPELHKIGKEDLKKYYEKLKQIDQLQYWFK